MQSLSILEISLSCSIKLFSLKLYIGCVKRTPREEAQSVTESKWRWGEIKTPIKKIGSERGRGWRQRESITVKH